MGKCLMCGGSGVEPEWMKGEDLGPTPPAKCPRCNHDWHNLIDCRCEPWVIDDGHGRGEWVGCRCRYDNLRYPVSNGNKHE